MKSRPKLAFIVTSLLTRYSMYPEMRYEPSSGETDGSLGLSTNSRFTNSNDNERSLGSNSTRHVSEQPPKMRVVRPEIPQHVADVVLCGLAKKPDDRPNTAGELVGRMTA